MSLGLLIRYGSSRSASAPAAPTRGANAVFDAVNDEVLANAEFALGWSFTPSKDISIAALSLRQANSLTRDETVRIVRHSDEAVVAEAAIPATTFAAWEHAVLPSLVTLESGVTYTVYREPTVFGTRAVRRDSSGSTPTYDPSITVVNTGLYGSPGGRPTSNSSSHYWSVSFSEQAPASGAYRLYRWRELTRVSGGAAYGGTNTLGVAATVSGADAAAGVAHAKATVDSAILNGLSNLVDGDTGTGFAASDNPHTVTIDLGSGNAITPAEYLVGAYPTASDTANRSYASWVFEASADGDSWTELDTVTGQSGWTLAEVRRFAL